MHDGHGTSLSYSATPCATHARAAAGLYTLAWAATPIGGRRDAVPVTRDYRHEPTLLTSQAVHALVRELLDYANTHQTWGVAVAEAFVDLIATRLSDTYAPLDPLLARAVLGGIRRAGPPALAYVDVLCTVLANLGDTRPSCANSSPQSGAPRPTPYSPRP